MFNIIRNKKTINQGQRRQNRPQKSAKAQDMKSSLRLGFWNIDGFDLQAAWVIEKILKDEVRAFQIQIL